MRFFLYRLAKYYRRNGVLATLKNLWRFVLRSVRPGADILFYVEIASLKNDDFTFPANFTAEPKRSKGEIARPDLAKLQTLVGEDILNNQMKERFAAGAVLWLARIDDELVGFMWAIRKSPIEHFFFPLTDNDIYCFDSVVWPEWRGQRIMLHIWYYVLCESKKEGCLRGFGAVKSWNTSMIRSHEMSFWHKLGMARKIHVFGKDLVIWREMSTHKKVLD